MRTSEASRREGVVIMEVRRVEVLSVMRFSRIFPTIRRWFWVQASQGSLPTRSDFSFAFFVVLRNVVGCSGGCSKSGMLI